MVTFAFRLGFRITLLIGVFIALGVGIVSASFNNGLNLGAGVLTGLYPFLVWVWLGRLLITGQKVRPSRRVLIVAVSVLKMVLLGVIFYLVIKPEWVKLPVFVPGMILAQAVMIGVVLMRGENNVR